LPARPGDIMESITMSATERRDVGS
jgi:hypothetical protein